MAKISRSLVSDVMQLVNRYSRYHQSILTIEQFTNFGKKANIKGSYQFLRHEVPVRLAHIMQEINHLPKNLKSMPSVELVRSWYVQSFADLIEYQDKQDSSDATIEKFTQALYTIKRRHDNTVETMAQGVMELREAGGEMAIAPTVQYFLDRFFMNRVGVRLLITQHLALHEEALSKSAKSRFIGLFDPDLSVKLVVKDAADNASMLCSHYFLDAPEVVIREHNAVKAGESVHIAYVPSHLYHMLFELLKNAMRATEEAHRGSSDKPKIEVDIVKGREDLTIRVADHGGGIRRSQMDKLFHYHYTTAPQPATSSGMAALAGYGYGLPLSRIYAKYFGGDIQIISVEGLGTHAYVYLKALSAQAQEVIPMYNSSVARTYKEEQGVQSLALRDWSSDSFFDGQAPTYARPMFARKVPTETH